MSVRDEASDSFMEGSCLDIRASERRLSVFNMTLRKRCHPPPLVARGWERLVEAERAAQ